jgi:2,4-dienoyl-CoA reductase-like NADH-dependent reductase (Old Yellow Enzyme family)
MNNQIKMPVAPDGLFSPLTLPNGAVIPNRIAKAAMSENLAGSGQLPDERLVLLEKTFALGGAGLLITGNVMIDPCAIGEPANVVLQKNTDLTPFKRWAKAARVKGAQVWMQINHPGRQVMAALSPTALAPSEVAMEMGKLSGMFAKSKAMTETDILETIQRFADTARQAEASGFTGVQIHAAHGYLISQFLSPRTNLRNDQWGGSLENRARFLLEVVKAVRAAVTKKFCVAVKINSADFQRGGFDADDAREVVKMLNHLPVDLVELSGGNYESPAMVGQTGDDSTLAREAYFLEFARDISKVARMPIMTTGGIRRRAVAAAVLAEGVSMVGMATALAMNPALPLAWSEGRPIDGKTATVKLKSKMWIGFARLAIAQRQLHRIGGGSQPKPNAGAVASLIRQEVRNKLLTLRYRSWVKGLVQQGLHRSNSALSIAVKTQPNDRQIIQTQ